MAFLWAFEPQLNSLHPPVRQNANYCSSMRDESQYVGNMERDLQRRPTPLEGAAHFLNFDRQDVDCRQIINEQLSYWGRKSAYNFQNLLDSPWGTHDTHTIEFRQHQGSLNGPEIRNWVQTVVGLIDFVQQVDTTSFAQLLLVLESETWEKEGDGEDELREEQMGPVLADEGFTVIDLLVKMELWESALYYNKRLTRHHGNRRPITTGVSISTSEQGREVRAVGHSCRHHRLQYDYL